MKVLFITGADKYGGSFTMSKQLLESVKRFNNSMEYITITQEFGPLNEWCNVNDIENYVFPYRYCVYHPLKNKFLNALKHFIKYFMITVLNRIALYRISKMGILKDVDIIHTNINRDLFGMMISKKYNIPNITHLREFSKAHFGLELIYRNQIDVMNKYSYKFIAISNVVKADWINYGLHEDKIEVIYDGLDVNKYKVTHEMRKEDAPLKIVMCGTIYEGKGQKELVEAVTLLLQEGLNIIVDIYGNVVRESYFSEMKKYICSQGVQSQIRFLGYKDNLNELLSNYDVGVVCSKAEGLGLVTVEYMLSGLVVIASDTGANPELLHEEELGYLYTFGNIESLKSAINYVYKNSKEGRIKAEKAIKNAKSEFLIENTIESTRDVYLTAAVQYGE